MKLMRTEEAGCEMVLCTGGMSVDCFDMVARGRAKKGDVLGVAQGRASWPPSAPAS